MEDIDKLTEDVKQLTLDLFSNKKNVILTCEGLVISLAAIKQILQDILVNRELNTLQKKAVENLIDKIND